MTFGAHVDEEILAEVCAAAFAPLARSDQRERGIEFVRGLLTARGRRSIRNIATGIGGRAANQRLHHFVSASTWDWTRVRRALAGHLEQIEPPQAWVVRHVVIPKSGRSSVGVERRYSASLGRVLSAQHAIGLWGVSHSVSCPVDWRLRIPEDWPADEARRNHAASPERAEGEDGHEGVLRLATGAPRSWGLPTRPVVLDARGSKIGPQGLVRELTRSGVPFLMRIGGDVAVGAADPALPQWEQPAAASLLMTAAGRLRRPIGPSVAAAVRVRLPGPDVARDPLVLLGIGHAGRWPAQLWLSNQTDTGARHLVPLTWLSGRLEREAEELSTRTGMYDFSGRSFAGWHRHMTLASVAHLVARLGRQPERGTSEALEPVDSPLPAA